MTKREARKLELKAQDQVKQLILNCETEKEYDARMADLDQKVSMFKTMMETTIGKAKVNWYIWFIALTRVLWYTRGWEHETESWNWN